MKTPSQSIALIDALSLFLPSGLLDYFTLVDSISQDTCFILYLEEKAVIPDEYSDLHLHSKGFFPEIEVQDFPIRGKAIYLRIKPNIDVGKIRQQGRSIVMTGLWYPPALASQQSSEHF